MGHSLLCCRMPYILKCIQQKNKVYLSSPLEHHKNKYNQVQKISIQKLKWIKSLQLKKNRDKEGYFIIEGEKIGLECLIAIPQQIKMIVCLPEHSNLVPEDLHPICSTISKKDLERISKLKTPNKIIIVINKSKETQFRPKEKFLILDNIQDPGNMGTIMRTADWFGINQIICSPQCADFHNFKTLQASMGSFLRVDVFYKELSPFLETHQFNITGAFLDGAPLKQNSLIHSNAILLGNEGQGISPQLKKFCNNPIKILGSGEAESLNVSVAASILIYEWTK